MKNWPKCDKLPNLVTLALVILTKIKPDMSKKVLTFFQVEFLCMGPKLDSIEKTLKEITLIWTQKVVVEREEGDG